MSKWHARGNEPRNVPLIVTQAPSGGPRIWAHVGPGWGPGPLQAHMQHGRSTSAQTSSSHVALVLPKYQARRCVAGMHALAALTLAAGRCPSQLPASQQLLPSNASSSDLSKWHRAVVRCRLFRVPAHAQSGAPLPPRRAVWRTPTALMPCPLLGARCSQVQQGSRPRAHSPQEVLK